MSVIQSVKMLLPRPFRLWTKRSLGAWVRIQEEHASQCFSQEGEELIINRLLQPPKSNAPGFYIDVGAHHPHICSNTYYFYNKGWRGINIDAKPGTKALFELKRPRDINLELAIAESAGELTYYEFNLPLLNGFDLALAETRASDPAFRLTGTRQVPVRPLRDVLTEHMPEGQLIDFMSVDVEGLDLQVLRSNDWNQFRPRLILAEDASVVTLDDARSAPLCKYLATVGYTAIGKAALTMFFVADGHLVRTSTGHMIS
jgi:FkbM family methyltransferase